MEAIRVSEHAFECFPPLRLETFRCTEDRALKRSCFFIQRLWYGMEHQWDRRLRKDAQALGWHERDFAKLVRERTQAEKEHCEKAWYATSMALVRGESPERVAQLSPRLWTGCHCKHPQCDGQLHEEVFEREWHTSDLELQEDCEMVGALETEEERLKRLVAVRVTKDRRLDSRLPARTRILRRIIEAETIALNHDPA